MTESDESVPWCFQCDSYAVPTETGKCGECGASIQIISEPPDDQDRNQGDNPV